MSYLVYDIPYNPFYLDVIHHWLMDENNWMIGLRVLLNFTWEIGKINDASFCFLNLIDYNVISTMLCEKGTSRHCRHRRHRSVCTYVQSYQGLWYMLATGLYSAVNVTSDCRSRTLKFESQLGHETFLEIDPKNYFYSNFPTSSLIIEGK